MRVGVHPNNLHLTLASSWPGAAGWLGATAFLRYPEGRETGRLLAEGAFDVGGTGSTPPVLAEAAGLDVVYVAASAPRPANGAVVVRPGSAIRGPADLVGARVALVDGSFHTYLLARVLDAAGVALGGVERRDLSPAASRAALAAGEVDAWVAMAPHLDAALAAGEMVPVPGCAADAIPNRSLFWTLARRRLPEATIVRFAAGLARLGRAIAAEPDRAADLLAGVGGVGRDAWMAAVRGRDWTVVPADATILREQREEALALRGAGELPLPAPAEEARP